MGDCGRATVERHNVAGMNDIDHPRRTSLEEGRNPLGMVGRRAGLPLEHGLRLELIREGNPIYAWPYEQRQVWRPPHMPLAGRLLARATQPRRPG